MPFDSDVALLGTGVAPLVAANHLLAQGKSVLLLNPDCVVRPASCEMLLAWMRAHPDVGAAGPRIHNADGTLQPTARKFPDRRISRARKSA